MNNLSTLPKGQPSKASRKRASGFTLLELLVVVTILAIVGGGMVTAFAGQDVKAARGVATASIAGVEDAIRIYVAQEGDLPDDLESLTCLDLDLTAHPTAVAQVTDVYATADEVATGVTWTAAAEQQIPLGGYSNLAQEGGGLGYKVADKFTLALVDASALIAGGVKSLRYAEIDSCDTDSATGGTKTSLENGGTFPSGSLATMNIPNHVFEAPRTGGSGTGATFSRNRGRGFTRDLNFGGSTTAGLMIWNAGTGGYNNVKVGAGATDVLVGLGVGNASELVGDDTSPFGKAPYYGQLAKDKYAHFIALVKIGTDDDGDVSAGFSPAGEATIKAVVDARGDFLDEEFAEFTGQKT
jgi:prepilin-type N-terminal cleavage/methylation domain-containing protein